MPLHPSSVERTGHAGARGRFSSAAAAADPPARPFYLGVVEIKQRRQPPTEPSEQKVHDSWRKAQEAVERRGAPSWLSEARLLPFPGRSGKAPGWRGAGWERERGFRLWFQPLISPTCQAPETRSPPRHPLAAPRPLFAGTSSASTKGSESEELFRPPRKRGATSARALAAQAPPQKSLPKVSMHFPPTKALARLRLRLSPRRLFTLGRGGGGGFPFTTFQESPS